MGGNEGVDFVVEKDLSGHRAGSSAKARRGGCGLGRGGCGI